MRTFFLYGIILFIVISCSSVEQKYEGYSFNQKGFYYKLLAFKEGYYKAQNTDVVTATVQFSVIDNDSLSYTNTFVIPISKQDSICLPVILQDVREGDSISFIVPNTACIRNELPLEFTDLFADYKELKIVVSIHSIVDKKAYEQKLKEYEIWLKSKKEFELEYIQKYLKTSNFAFQEISNGIYKCIIREGNGDIPNIGDIININYQGSLLSGEIINHFTALEFKLGSQWQVIDGISKAIETMKQGERSKILVSSEYAWGENGTSDGSIQPFTTVIFDLELLSIKKP